MSIGRFTSWWLDRRRAVIASRPRVEAPHFAAERSPEGDRPGERCFAGKHPACLPARRRRNSRGWLACGLTLDVPSDLGARRRSDRTGRLAGRGAAGARTVEHALAGLPFQPRHRVRDRHAPADQARRGAHDGEPLVRQLPRDARPRLARRLAGTGSRSRSTEFRTRPTRTRTVNSSARSTCRRPAR